MAKPSSWILGTPVPDIPTLTTLELLKVWSENRNSNLSTMAAEEITRRLFKQHKEEMENGET